ncbi:MAG: response regulator, partial [Bacteroidales bacterium]|nr:response regulator [Bacteroidales bacterium]
GKREILSISFAVDAQKKGSYFFETINSRNGLSSDIITEIYQDSEGLLWILTHDGLNRYDGYSFKTLKPDYSEDVTFTGNHFTAVDEDEEGRLWLGTHDNGINIYNKNTGKVSVINTKTENPTLPSGDITDLYIDRKGNKWIGTNNYGLLCLDTTGHLTVYRTKRDHLASVSSIKVIYGDSEGRLWIGTWNNGLFYYDRPNNDFIHVDLPWPYPIDNKNVVSIHEDQQGRLLVGTWGHGLFRLDSVRQKVHNIEHYSYLNESLAGKLNDNEVGNIIYSIETDKTGKIWFGTNDGILISDGKNIENPLKIRANQDLGYAPDHSQIYSLFSDREGIIWLGTQGGGLHKVNLDRNRFKLHEVTLDKSQLIRESSVYSFCELDKENILIGVKTEGFLQYNETTHSYTSYTDLELFQQLPRLNLVYDFHKDQFGRIWFGTRYRGAFMMDPEKESYIKLNSRYDNFICRAVYAFMRDVDNNIWVGTNNGLYIFKYHEHQGEQYSLFHASHSQDDTTSLSGNSITSIYQDSYGDVWLGTMNKGLNRYTDNFVKKDMKFQRYRPNPDNENSLSSNIINDIYEDSEERLFIGTNGGGLVKYNRDKDYFTRYGKNEGLIADNVTTIMESIDTSLWLGTNQGVVRLHIDNNGGPHFTNYTVKDGLQGRIFIRGAKFKSSDDSTFYFGGHNGFNSFKPARIRFQTVKPKLAITELKFNGQDKHINAGSDSLIEVPHHVKTLSIEFSALSYKHPAHNQYAYILEGYNDDWQYKEASDRKAVFTSLPRGDYTFKVKAGNSNGFWCREPVTLNFTVEPSPYASNVAFIIYSLIVFGIFYLIIRMTVYRTKMKQELKWEEELRAKKEKQHQFKLRLLTNISHEFLTPLSIISCVVDDSSASKNFSGQSLRIIQRNVTMLKNLVNQFMLIRKSEAGTLQLKVASNNLKEHLNEIYSTFYPLAGKQNLQYDMFLSNDLNTGYYDRDKLEKILHNLLSNAFKYTEQGHVSVYGQHIQKNGITYAQISVTDTGEGIPEDKLDQIFKRFKRIDSQKTTGIGIGLELTKSLIELHKGSISVRSRLQEGTSFIIDFPIDKWAYLDHEIISTENPEDSSVIIEDQSIILQQDHKFFYDQQIPDESIKKEDKRVLLIEDNEELRNLLYTFLSRYYNVKALDNCDKAVSITQTTFPDLIVSDIMMPGTDGYEFTRQIKNDLNTSHIPIILLTAKIDDESKIKGYDYGADSYVTKPVNLKLLHTRIESLFEGWENLRKYYSGNNGSLEPQVSTLNLTSKDEQYIKRAIEIIENNITKPDFNVPSLVHDMGTSNSMLYRKFNKIVGLSPNEYIKNSRLKMAAHMLYDENYSITEVAYSTGFNDLSYFGKCFKKYYGKSPTEYKG